MKQDDTSMFSARLWNQRLNKNDKFLIYTCAQHLMTVIARRLLTLSVVLRRRNCCDCEVHSTGILYKLDTSEITRTDTQKCCNVSTAAKHREDDVDNCLFDDETASISTAAIDTRDSCEMCVGSTISTNSITSICCGFVVQQVVQQIYNQGWIQQID